MRLLKYLGLLTLFVCAAALSSAQDLVPAVTAEDWEEINFEFNSAVLSDGFPSLLRLADLLKNNPDYRVQLQGHTDHIGNPAYNEKLSRQRAEAVRAFLTKYGARPDQITMAAMGERDPRVDARTREGRFVNRRVTMSVTDGQQRTVSAGGVGDAIKALQAVAHKQEQCCGDILKRLDKLDDILAAVKDLKSENDRLKQDIAALQQSQQGLQKEVAGLPRPPEKAELGQIMEATAQQAIERAKPSRFSILALNVGPTLTSSKRGEFPGFLGPEGRRSGAGNITFTGKGRYFAPFGKSGMQALQAEAEYLYYRDRQEGQFDIGLVNRINRFQAGLFSSIKHVNLPDFGGGGTLGQAALTADVLFSRGRVGFFGTKAYLDERVISRAPVNGSNVLFNEAYLKVVDQVGGSAQVGAWNDAYFEGNFGAMFRRGGGNRPGGMVRFVQPIHPNVAFTVEAGLNETLIGANNSGRVVFGVQLGNWLRPKEFMEVDHAVPVDIPRLRYEVLTRQVRTGNTAPVADAGPDLPNAAPGTVTLDGTGSYDPEGDALTYEWRQISGPTVSISGMNTATATFEADAGETYAFRLTVKDPQGAQATDRVTIATVERAEPRILRLMATPANISAGEVSTLAWETEGAQTVTISGIGQVAPSGATTVSPTQTTTYTLTATNRFGEATSTATVQVTPGQVPRIMSFSASPLEILPNEPVSLAWSVENAAEVTISGVGAVQASGTSTVSPAETTTYTLTARNAQGQVSATSVVTVAAPVKVLTFAADPPIIRTPGAPITLRWTTENAREVVITGVGTLPANGSVTVNPNTPISYSLTAYGRRSQANAFVVIQAVGQGASAGPVCDAGLNQTTQASYFRLAGSGSDPLGGTVTYSWRVGGLKPAKIEGATTATPRVIFQQGYGDYVFELSVTDQGGNQCTDTVRVNFIDP